MLGYFVNNLFTNYNVPQLPYAPDWNTMLSAIKLTIPRDLVLGIAEGPSPVVPGDQGSRAGLLHLGRRSTTSITRPS